MGNGDFKVFLEAAKLIKAGENPYNKWIHVGGESYCLYFYSPFWAILLIPFAGFPNFIPNIIWLLANVFFLYRILILLKNYINSSNLSSKQTRLILVLTLLMSIRFILYNFGMIQMTLFLLWSILESVRLVNDDKFILGGLILALAINIKILPVVLLPYLIYRKYLKAALSVFLFSICLILLPAIFVGWSKNTFLLSEWWSVINPRNTEHLIESELGPHSLTALIPTLLSETNGNIDIHRNIASFSHESAILITNLIRGFLALFTLYFLRWPPFKECKSKIFQIYELAYIILLIPLIFPHQQKYAFALIIPVSFYMSYFIVTKKQSQKSTMNRTRWYSILILMGLSFSLMTLSSDGIIGRHLNQITQHFKTITWGTLLLIIALLLASPKMAYNSERIED